MYDKLKEILEFIGIVVMFCFMEMVTILLPHYIAYVQCYGRKARSIVYGYWVVNKQECFKKFLFSMSGDVVGKSIVSKDLLGFTIRIQQGSTTFSREGYIGNHRQYCNGKLRRFLNKIRYYFYYWFVWIWLDDVNCVNGLSKDVLMFYRDRTDVNSPLAWTNIDTDDLSYSQRFKYLDDVKFVSNVFDLEYHLGKYDLPPFYKRVWALKYQYINNFVRDKCVRLKRYNRLYLSGRFGWKFLPELQRSTAVMFGVNIVQRGA